LVIGNRSSVIPFKRDCLSTIGGTCAFLSKNGTFFEGRKFVTTYTERDRKNFEKMDFRCLTTNGFD
jgi:hypothetical protein